MKLLLDANLSLHMAARLQEEYPGSKHISELGMLEASDDELWTYAKHNDFTIVSKDKDFANRVFLAGGPPKVIWLRVGNFSTATILELIGQARNNIAEFEKTPEAGLLVLPAGVLS